MKTWIKPILFATTGTAQKPKGFPTISHLALTMKESPTNQNDVSETVESEGFFYHGLYKNILFIETFILIVSLTIHLLMLYVRPEFGSLSTDSTKLDYISNRWTIVSAATIFYFIFSRFNLIESSFQKKIFLLSSMTAVFLVAYTLGLSPFVFPILAILVAKSVLLLDRINIWWLCVIAYSVCVTGVYCKFLIHDPILAESSSNPLVSLIFAGGSILKSFQALVIIVLVAALVRSLVSAKKEMLEKDRLANDLSKLAKDVERARIAQDLHDSVGHVLTSLKLQLEVATKLFHKDSNKAESALKKASELSVKSLQDVRSAVSIMKLEEFDLNDSIEALLKELATTGDIAVSSDLDLPEIDPASAYQIFRVIQESTTNILRHAKASSVELKATTHGLETVISIKDDGVGFDLTQLENGSGINGMKSRIESIGGTFSISGDREKGTIVKIVL